MECLVLFYGTDIERAVPNRHDPEELERSTPSKGRFSLREGRGDVEQQKQMCHFAVADERGSFCSSVGHRTGSPLSGWR